MLIAYGTGNARGFTRGEIVWTGDSTMWGTVMAFVVAATILSTSLDAFAMAGGSSRKHGGGGGDTSYSSYEQGSWENGSNYTVSTPEPGTLLLVASGITGLALWVRRRK